MEATLQTKRAVLATAIAMAFGVSTAFAASDTVTPANNSGQAAQATAGPSSAAPPAASSNIAPANGSSSSSSTTTANTNTTNNSGSGMTGKQKATTIGAGTGAVAGAVVGGPVGALVGAGVGAYVGHEGTDSHGRPTDPNARGTASHASDGTVRKAQAALNDQGFDAGAVDGRYGPTTQNAVRRFQSSKGLTETGTLDNSTLNALGVQ